MGIAKLNLEDDRLLEKKMNWKEFRQVYLLIPETSQ